MRYLAEHTIELTDNEKDQGVKVAMATDGEEVKVFPLNYNLPLRAPTTVGSLSVDSLTFSKMPNGRIMGQIPVGGKKKMTMADYYFIVAHCTSQNENLIMEMEADDVTRAQEVAMSFLANGPLMQN